MNGFFLLIPFLIIRFGYLSRLNKNALRRAAHFPNMQGNESIAYIVYQLSNVAIVIYLAFLKVIFVLNPLFIVGSFVYIIGLVLCAITIHDFALPSTTGINTRGIYRYSRNPMYVSYFIIFIGCSILTQSIWLFLVVMLFQIAAHWIILSEERWCMEQFKVEYTDYMKQVRRYI
ncbi:MAG: isoprenylcysteine carboxylmethyltransferase family protein [Bacilli bacterium]|uniref:methyltransferase family protein n=1 Tax=Anaerorhabdus sp. TaxID=1872524 RepID=UPI002FC7A0F6